MRLRTSSRVAGSAILLVIATLGACRCMGVEDSFRGLIKSLAATRVLVAMGPYAANRLTSAAAPEPVDHLRILTTALFPKVLLTGLQDRRVEWSMLWASGGNTMIPLGYVAFDGGEIVRVRGGSALRLERLMLNVAGFKKEKMYGTWVWSGAGSDGSTVKILVAQASSDTLVATTDAESMGRMLASIRKGVQAVREDSMKEMSLVNKSVPIWGVRHFVPGVAYEPETSGLPIADDRVVGIAVQMMSDRDLELFYESGDASAPVRLVASLGSIAGVHADVEAKKTASGVFRVGLRVGAKANPEIKDSIPLFVLGCLGFGLPV